MERDSFVLQVLAVPDEQHEELGIPLLEGIFSSSLPFGFAIKIGESFYLVLGHHQQVEDAGNEFIFEGPPDGVFVLKDQNLAKGMFERLYLLTWGDRPLAY